MFFKSVLFSKIQFISPLFFKNHCCSVAVIPSTTLLNPAKNAEEPSKSSAKNTNLLPMSREGRFTASNAISGETHLNRTAVSSFSYSNALKICAKLGFLSEGKQLHCHAIKLFFDHQICIQNQILNMYAKCGSGSDAHQLFDEMPVRNIVSWNIMISGFFNFGCNAEMIIDKTVKNSSNSCIHSCQNCALFFFKKMLMEMVEPDYITFVGILGLCVRLEEIELGKQIHSHIVKLRFCLNAFVGSVLIDLYAKCKFIKESRQVFDKIDSRDLVLWNVMISGYAQNGLGKEAFKVFDLMQKEGKLGDGFTFTSLLNCSSILVCQESGKQIHGLVIRLSLDLDVLVASALVDMYAKSGNIEEASRIFDGMATRNTISWNTMIVGCGQNRESNLALKNFKQMLRGGSRPDDLTLASILSSCANLAAGNEALQIHAYAIKSGFEAFGSVGNALITAYSKCGSIDSAFLFFALISRPDVVTYTSMIGAFAFHGLAKEAINLFETMLREGVRPDRIAFLGVLSACSHGGLVNKGFHYFNSMREDHQIVPDPEHFACVVDLLGRAGRLDEVCRVLTNMPFEPSVDVLRALLGACKAHGNMGLAEWVAVRLFELEAEEPVNYALISNVYASFGSWNSVAEIRKMMKNRCARKIPGCSWTQIGSKVHTFVSNDKSHPEAVEIYKVLEMLVTLMKEKQYFPSMNFCVDGVGDECVLEP